jgi:hypothetical protein
MGETAFVYRLQCTKRERESKGREGGREKQRLEERVRKEGKETHASLE